MATLTPSRFWIDGTPGEFVPGQVIDVRLARGYGYHTFTLKVREGWRCDSELQQKQNAVTLKFECAAQNVTQATSIECKEWYILARRALEWGWVEYTFADQRWHKRHNKLTAQYNIISYGSKYRKDSLYAASRAWTCLEAAEDALQQLGFQVTIDPKLPQHLRSVTLPDNLGNSEAGGFFGASLPEFGPLMLEPIRCDMVPTLDGKLMITDRVREQSKDLKGYVHIGGQVREADVHWQKPKKLIVEFEKRVERRWTFTEVSGTATASPGDPLTPQLDNVAPRWDADDPDSIDGFVPIGDVGGYAAYDLIPLLNLRLTFAGVVSLLVLKNHFMAPTLYNTESATITPKQLGKLRIAEALLREHWRRTFRVRVSTTAIDDVRSRYAHPEIGRLQEDGTNRPDGAVFCDYVVDLRYPQRRAGDHPLNAVFSENVAYSQARPAPFSARWIDRGDLVFQLVEGAPRFNKRAYYPGLLDGKGKHYGDIKNVIRGKAKLAIDSSVKFRNNFTLVVYWHALFLGLPGSQARQYQRTHKVEKLLFGNGEVDSLTLRCESMTANFGYDGTFPGALLNSPALADEAIRMQRETRDALTQGRAGIMRHGGLDVLAVGGFHVAGDIHEVAILVGQRAAFSIDTHITVLPGARLYPAPVYTRTPARKAEALQ
jgi:hypothetical protein